MTWVRVKKKLKTQSYPTFIFHCWNLIFINDFCNDRRCSLFSMGAEFTIVSIEKFVLKTFNLCKLCLFYLWSIMPFMNYCQDYCLMENLFFTLAFTRMQRFIHFSVYLSWLHDTFEISTIHWVLYFKLLILFHLADNKEIENISSKITLIEKKNAKKLRTKIKLWICHNNFEQ